MKNLTWKNPEQLFVAQVLINKVKSKCCGIKDDKIYTSTVNTQDYVAWKDGYYQFKHQKMNIVLEKLCKYYGVKIHWDDKVSELTCSGKLDLKDDLDKVFNALRNAAPIEIEQTNEFINIIVKH